jgi:S1-C subfamily serine protease
LQLMFSTVGFFVGLLFGSWLAAHLVVNVSQASTKLVLILGIESVFALLMSYLGEILGAYLSRGAHRFHLTKTNQVFGAIFELVSMLAIIWLVASGLTNVQTARLGYYTQHSLVVRTLDDILPPPPDFFARLERIITPNGFPNVFVGLEPQHTNLPPPKSISSSVVAADERSVVKVEGQGCGGLVEGSGFVVANNIVVTNAHVIAGIASPNVIDSNSTYRATPIWFDPNLDLAVLRVNGLADPALTLDPTTLSYGDAGAVLGYPGNTPTLNVQSAVVIDQVDAQGQNIYNQGLVNREIYELESNVEPGNSGGPLIAANGQVAGIVFAKSADQPDIGYALLISDVKASIQSAESRNQSTSDGQCSAD